MRRRGEEGGIITCSATGTITSLASDQTVCTYAATAPHEPAIASASTWWREGGVAWAWAWAGWPRSMGGEAWRGEASGSGRWSAPGGWRSPCA